MFSVRKTWGMSLPRRLWGTSCLNLRPEMAIDEEDQYTRQVRRVLLTTLGLNALVVVAKLAAGFAAGSLSVVSDAIHSSTDTLNNLVGIAIVRLARSAPNEEHPHGHQKFETLAAFGIAGFLLITAFEVGAGDWTLPGHHSRGAGVREDPHVSWQAYPTV